MQHAEANRQTTNKLCDRWQDRVKIKTNARKEKIIMAKNNRDYPLAPSVFDDEIKGKKLEKGPSPKTMSPSSVNLDKVKSKFPEIEKRERKASMKKNLKEGAKMIGEGAAGLVGSYYALTKPAGGKPQKDYSGRQTGTTPKKRIWLWEKEQ